MEECGLSMKEHVEREGCIVSFKEKRAQLEIKKQEMEKEIERAIEREYMNSRAGRLYRKRMRQIKAKIAASLTSLAFVLFLSVAIILFVR